MRSSRSAVHLRAPTRMARSTSPTGHVAKAGCGANCRCSRTRSLLGRAQGLVEVGLNVFEIFDADGERDVVVRGPGSLLFLRAELLMRRRGGMNDEAFRVANVGQMREQFHG